MGMLPNENPWSHVMNKCFIEESHQLERFHDGELEAAAAESVRGHLAQCPSCQTALREFAEIGHALRSRFDQELPAGLTARLQSAAMAQRESRRRRVGWGLVAAASALLVSSLWLVGYTQRSGTDRPEVMAQWEEYVVSPPVEEEEYSDVSNRTLVAIHIPTHTMRETGNE